MPGHVVLSHGSHSAPEATKVSALARVAEALGWSTFRPDYREDDAAGFAGAVAPRLARLIAALQDAPRPRVLVGSSMGAFVSALASAVVPCDGAFLIALPAAIPGQPRALTLASGMPALLVHGYRDEVCPLDATLAFARRRGMAALLLDGDHRLADQVPAIERQFRAFLEALAT